MWPSMTYWTDFCMTRTRKRDRIPLCAEHVVGNPIIEPITRPRSTSRRSGRFFSLFSKLSPQLTHHSVRYRLILPTTYCCCSNKTTMINFHSFCRVLLVLSSGQILAALQSTTGRAAPSVSTTTTRPYAKSPTTTSNGTHLMGGRNDTRLSAIFSSDQMEELEPLSNVSSWCMGACKYSVGG
jgi:hypothetical protein